MIRAVAFCFVLAACGASSANPPPAAAAITAERARAIAIETGTGNGYDPAVFTEVDEPRRDAEDGTWWVHVQHAPPAPTGGHDAVTIDGDTGAATLRHGAFRVSWAHAHRMARWAGRPHRRL